MKYALINNNIVVNAIEAEENYIATLTEYDQVIRTDTGTIGDSYINGEFIRPTSTPAPVEAILNLTKLEFLRRFTAEERIAIRASTNPIIVDFMELLNLAENVRLDDADTIAGVNYLESIALLAVGRAAIILTPETR